MGLTTDRAISGMGLTMAQIISMATMDPIIFAVVAVMTSCRDVVVTIF